MIQFLLIFIFAFIPLISANENVLPNDLEFECHSTFMGYVAHDYLVSTWRFKRVTKRDVLVTFSQKATGQGAKEKFLFKGLFAVEDYQLGSPDNLRIKIRGKDHKGRTNTFELVIGINRQNSMYIRTVIDDVPNQWGMISNQVGTIKDTMSCF